MPAENVKRIKEMKSAGYKNTVLSRATIVAMLAIGAAAFMPASPVFAQDAALPTQEVNITLNQAPVRTALDTLFKSAGLNYTIDPTVTGLVTVSLRAIPFDVALRSILRASDPPLSYTVEDGIYNIQPRDETININTNGAQSTVVAPVTAAAADTTGGDDSSTVTQVVPLRLEYANAALILRYALSGSETGYIPSLDAPPSTGTTGSGQGGSTGALGGLGGSNGGFGGSSGGFGGSSGGFGGSTGGFGGSTGGFGGSTTQRY